MHSGILSGPEAWTSAAQDVPINEKGGTYIVSGWAKANAIGSTGTDYGSSEPYFGIIAKRCAGKLCIMSCLPMSAVYGIM